MSDTEMTKQQWDAEMRHAMWAEQDATDKLRKAISYRERMRVSGEVRGWVEQ